MTSKYGSNTSSINEFIMKYTNELTKRISDEYLAGKSVSEIAATLESEFAAAGAPQDVPERSLIAKLSSLGIYKKKEYLTKRGELPIKKEEYIEKIAKLLDVNVEQLESLEKVTKNVLALIATKLGPTDSPD
jgi:hypothetical protein